MINSNHIPSLNGHTLRHFGREATGEFDSPKAQSVRKKLHYNINQGKITLLVGRYESGKTMLMRQLRRELAEQVNFIRVRTYDDKKIPMPTILSSVVDQLSTEGARRDIRARSTQALRLLGKKMVNEQKPNCIIIDNTPDRLNLDTMNTIKLLMEDDYAGHSPVTSFIILCWPEFTDRFSQRNDIKHRLQQVHLDQNHGWFTLPDRIKYLKDVFGDAITPAARKRIANLKSLPGDINAYVVAMMQKAEKAGYDQLDDHVVQPSLKERYSAMKARHGAAYSYSVIADAAGVAKSTVSMVLESEPETESTRKVRQAMDALEDRFARQGEPSTGAQDNNQPKRKAS